MDAQRTGLARVEVTANDQRCGSRRYVDFPFAYGAGAAMTPHALHPKRLAQIGRRWDDDLARWWPSPGWVRSWFSAGYRDAHSWGEPRRTCLIRGLRAVLAAWAWATKPTAAAERKVRLAQSPFGRPEVRD